MRVVVGWFRRRVGLTGLEADLAAADARILELEAERDESQDQVERLLDQLADFQRRYQLLAGRLGTAEDNARRAQELAERLLEPPDGGACSKVRLRDEAEAEVFARQLFADKGSLTRTYKCRDCPRNPVTLQPFLHLTSVDPTLRGERGRVERARRRGREMLTGPDGLRHYALRDALADRLDSAG